MPSIRGAGSPPEGLPERAGFHATARYEHATNGGLHPFVRMERRA